MSAEPPSNAALDATSPPAPSPEPSAPPSAPNAGSERTEGERARASAPSQLGRLAPDGQLRLAVRFLGAVFAVTMLSWGGAKVACNRSKAPVLAPLPLATDVIVRRPKETALELQQRAASGHYEEALELAKGEARAALEAEAERCRREPAACEARRARADEVQTAAVLLTRDASSARVRAESVIGDERERYLMELELEGGRWSVVRRVADPG